MSRLYTGQHGEFFFWVQDGLFGGTENFRIDQKGGATGIEHSIQRLGRIARNNGSDTTQEQRQNARRTAWERAGWVRAASDDYPAMVIVLLPMVTKRLLQAVGVGHGRL